MSFHKFAWSAAFLVLAAPASAELSAEDVWSDWQAYVAGFGYRITGESRQNGAELSISEVEVTGGIAGAGDGATMQISSLLFTENADGTVTIAFPEVMPIEVTTTGIDGLQTKTSMTYQQDGLIMSASGTATASQCSHHPASNSLQRSTASGAPVASPWSPIAAWGCPASAVPCAALDPPG